MQSIKELSAGNLKSTISFYPAINWLTIFLCAALVFGIGLKKPTHNWDMIAYIASAYYDEGYRGEELRRKTYDEVRADTRDDEYAVLTNDEYRQGVARDGAALEQQLPFYRLKFAYMDLIKILHGLGLKYVVATYAISAFFAAATTVFAGYLLLQFGLSVVLLPFLVATTGVCAVNNMALQTIASLSTPDAIACFLSLIALLLCYRNDKRLYILAAALPIVRTDSIILSALLIIARLFMLWSNEKAASASSDGQIGKFSQTLRADALWAAFSFAAAASFYLAINKIYGGYGYLTLFNFSFVKFVPYPATLEISHRIQDYLYPYAKCAKDILESKHMVFYVMSLGVLSRVRDWKTIGSPFTVSFLLVPLMFVFAHLAVFPEYYERFFTFAIVALFIWLARQLMTREFVLAH